MRKYFAIVAVALAFTPEVNAQSCSGGGGAGARYRTLMENRHERVAARHEARLSHRAGGSCMGGQAQGCSGGQATGCSGGQATGCSGGVGRGYNYQYSAPQSAPTQQQRLTPEGAPTGTTVSTIEPPLAQPLIRIPAGYSMVDCPNCPKGYAFVPNNQLRSFR
jgi:hypothetical protein